MKILLLIVICLIARNSYSQGNSFKPKHEAILQAKHGERLSEQCSRAFPAGVDSFFTTTNTQVAILRNQLKLLIKLGLGKSPTILKRYGYQYIGLVIKDTSYIYVNAFFVDEMTLQSGWEEYPFMACDGGDRYWGVLFCLKTKKFSQLATNGAYLYR